MPKKATSPKPHRPELEPLSQYLEEVLERHQLSKLAFSRRTGFPHRTLSTIIKCQHPPEIQTIANLAAAISLLPGEGTRADVQDTLNRCIFQSPKNGKTMADGAKGSAMCVQYIGEVIRGAMVQEGLDPADPFDVQRFADAGDGVWATFSDMLILQLVIAGTLPLNRWEPRIYSKIAITLQKFTGDEYRFEAGRFNQEIQQWCDLNPCEPHDAPKPKKSRKKSARQV